MHGPQDSGLDLHASTPDAAADCSSFPGSSCADVGHARQTAGRDRIVSARVVAETISASVSSSQAASLRGSPGASCAAFYRESRMDARGQAETSYFDGSTA